MQKNNSQEIALVHTDYCSIAATHSIMALTNPNPPELSQPLTHNEALTSNRLRRLRASHPIMKNIPNFFRLPRQSQASSGAAFAIALATIVLTVPFPRIITCYDGHSQLLKFKTSMDQVNQKPGLGWCDPGSPTGDGVGCSLP